MNIINKLNVTHDTSILAKSINGILTTNFFLPKITDIIRYTANDITVVIDPQIYPYFGIR